MLTCHGIDDPRRCVRAQTLLKQMICFFALYKINRDFWFSDASASDTDKDGYKDGKEILAGYLPAGPGQLVIPAGTYNYPSGSVVKNYHDNKLYYRHSAGAYYSAGKNASDKLFVNNFLDERFVIISPFQVVFEIAKNKKISASEMEIIYPTKLWGEDIVKL